MWLSDWTEFLDIFLNFFVSVMSLRCTQLDNSHVVLSFYVYNICSHASSIIAMSIAVYRSTTLVQTQISH